MNPFIRFIVAEDEAVIRRHIIRKIEEASSSFKAVAEAYNGEEALSSIEQLQPDVLFTDIRMPRMNGLELIREVRSRYPDMPIVVLSGFDDFEYARQAVRFGVTDYLLKPLKPADLTKVMQAISRHVLDKRAAFEREMITSELQGNFISDHTNYFDDSAFFMILLNIGSLLNPMTSFRTAHRVHAVWQNINWEAAISALPPAIRNWWLIDEKAVNQKLLILSMEKTKASASEISTIAEGLLQALNAIVKPYALTIGCDLAGIPHEQIWSNALALRAGMERNVVIGQSAIFYQEEAAAPAPEATMPHTAKLHASVGHPNQIDMMIRQICEGWEKDKAPQRAVERSLSEWIRQLRKESANAVRISVNEVEAYLLQGLSESMTYADVRTIMLQVLKRAFVSEASGDPAEQIADKIEQFLRENYAEDISMEELAAQFNFTSAYLSKIFKKHKKETPLKYVTKIRIDEAKRLIVEHPDLELKIIGEMTGYEDQHYFSKVFKSKTGMSPSEYRSRHR
ncbi:response regulator [Paenibacillus sp. HB172176]|uniref:response regulator n=1 Tax=Paenibacillus sp. HB172176 TaxID=2493690 RepID=UPI00143A22A3|nr:response regulator [Paenibacillus sp. HB172176]